MKRLIVSLLLICFAVALLGCGDGATSQASSSSEDEGVEQGSPSDGSDVVGEHSSSSSSDESDDDDSGDSGEASSGGTGAGGTVSRENPGFDGVGFDSGRNDALVDAQPLDVVTWVVEPTISFGALDAEGVLNEGATLFDPMIDGEGAGFIVYFKGMTEPLALLLPDLGPMHIWETDHTVAEMEHEFEGATFEFRAYSPLFMDVGPGDLELRVFGYDSEGADALLAIRTVTVP